MHARDFVVPFHAALADQLPQPSYEFTWGVCITVFFQELQQHTRGRGGICSFWETILHCGGREIVGIPEMSPHFFYVSPIQGLIYELIEDNEWVTLRLVCIPRVPHVFHNRDVIH